MKDRCDDGGRRVWFLHRPNTILHESCNGVISVGDPRGSRGPFQFKAGHYATLGVGHGDKRIERAYSIVSSPYEEGREFFIGTQLQARVHKT